MASKPKRVVPTKGSVELGKLCAKLGRGGQERVREQVGCGTGVVCKWISGERKPDYDWMILLRDKFGIDVDWWGQTPPDKRRPVRAA